jgi:hypothetical protein
VCDVFVTCFSHSVHSLTFLCINVDSPTHICKHFLTCFTQVRERLALTFGKLLLRAPQSADAGVNDGRAAKVDLSVAKKQALFVDQFLRNADQANEE